MMWPARKLLSNIFHETDQRVSQTTLDRRKPLRKIAGQVSSMAPLGQRS